MLRRCQQLRQPPQELPGVTAVTVDMVGAVQTDNLLHGVFHQIHIVKPIENTAQGANNRRVPPLGFQQRRQLLIGFPLLTPGLQLFDLRVVDRLGSEQHMAQMSV